MTRSITTFVVGACVALALTVSVSAQTTIYSEDFSSVGGGTTPPAGWTTYASGMQPVIWRFDNPAPRTFDLPIDASFAICDSDQGGTGTAGISGMESSTFDVSSAMTVNLDFDQSYRDLTSGWSIDVFDGTMWNTVASQANNTTSGNFGYNMPNASSVASTSYDITAAAGAAANAQVRFVYEYGYDWWWAIDNVVISEPPANDLAMDSIDAPGPFDPAACELPSSGSTVTCTYSNAGGAVVPMGTLVNMLLRVDGMNVANEPYLLPADLNPGGTQQYTFTALANLVTAGAHTIECRINLGGDAVMANNSVINNYNISFNPPVAPGYFENFDNHTTTNGSILVPLGWTNVVGDSAGTNGDWMTRSGLTGSTNGGPLNGDHTTGSAYYMHIEDSGTANPNISLQTPCLDTSLATNPTIFFWHHSDVDPGTAVDNPLSIDVIDVTNGGVVTTDVAIFLGNGLGSDWTQQFVDLSSFAPSVVKVVFRGTNVSTDFVDDDAIDDFLFADLVSDGGQAPRPGMAVFDIDGAAKNLAGFGVSSNQDGPYFHSITQGTSFTMSWEGEANQPLTSFFAPLNRAAATFGAVGQMDCGVGPLDMMTGFPTDLVAFGNGILWATTPGAPFGFDALWITNGSGTGAITMTMPNFGAAPGSVLTTFQFGILSASSPFSYLSNAIEVSLN